MAFAPADSSTSTLTTAFHKPSHTCSGHNSCDRHGMLTVSECTLVDKTAIYETYTCMRQSLWNDLMPSTRPVSKWRIRMAENKHKTKYINVWFVWKLEFPCHIFTSWSSWPWGPLYLVSALASAPAPCMLPVNRRSTGPVWHLVYEPLQHLNDSLGCTISSSPLKTNLK